MPTKNQNVNTNINQIKIEIPKPKKQKQKSIAKAEEELKNLETQDYLYTNPTNIYVNPNTFGYNQSTLVDRENSPQITEDMTQPVANPQPSNIREPPRTSQEVRGFYPETTAQIIPQQQTTAQVIQEPSNVYQQNNKSLRISKPIQFDIDPDFYKKLQSQSGIITDTQEKPIIYDSSKIEKASMNKPIRLVNQLDPDYEVQKPKKRGGRKKGSKNKPKESDIKQAGYDPFRDSPDFNKQFPNIPNIQMNLELSKPIKLGGLRGQF